MRLTELLNLIRSHPIPDDGTGEPRDLCSELSDRHCAIGANPTAGALTQICNQCPLVRARGIITDMS